MQNVIKEFDHLGSLKVSIIDHVRQLLTNNPFERLLVGYSGGSDSHVILHVLNRLKPEFNYQLQAIHLDHRLYPECPDWAIHCQNVCSELGIHCYQEVHPIGFSRNIEAEARNWRYGLIKDYLDQQTAFVSGHHQSDQAETFLLQLMRGAGIEGLKSMSVLRAFGCGYYFRPLLHIPKKMILDYAKKHQLHYVDDPSNVNTDISRNFIRHRVIPLLQERWPSATQSITTSVDWLSEIEYKQKQDILHLFELKKDSVAVFKRKLMDYTWQKAGIRLTQNQLYYLQQHFLSDNPQAHPELIVGKYTFRRYLDFIVLTDQVSLPSLPKYIDINRVTHYGNIGQLIWKKSNFGLNPEQFPNLIIRPLSGQRFHPHYRKHSQTIKKLMYENKVPYWLRSVLPGIYADHQLVAIAGIGVDQQYMSHTNKGFLPNWQFSEKVLGINPQILESN